MILLGSPFGSGSSVDWVGSRALGPAVLARRPDVNAGQPRQPQGVRSETRDRLAPCPRGQLDLFAPHMHHKTGCKCIIRTARGGAMITSPPKARPRLIWRDRRSVGPHPEGSNLSGSARHQVRPFRCLLQCRWPLTRRLGGIARRGRQAFDFRHPGWARSANRRTARCRCRVQGWRSCAGEREGSHSAGIPGADPGGSRWPVSARLSVHGLRPGSPPSARFPVRDARSGRTP